MPRRFPAKTLRMTSVLTRLSFIGFVTALSSRCVDPVIPQIAWGLRVDPGAVALLSTAFALPFAGKFVEDVSRVVHEFRAVLNQPMRSFSSLREN